MNNKFFLALLVFILFISGIYAAENKTTQVISCLNESYKALKQLSDDNFSVQRINDTLKIAKDLYDFQNKKKSPDFTVVIAKCEEIAKVKELAYTSRDQIYGIEKSYLNFLSKMEKLKANSTEIVFFYNSLKQEFSDERYENVIKGIPELERKMIEKEAEETTMNLFYKSISRNLKTIIIENYITIIIILVLLVIGFLLYRTKIRIFLIKHKISKLETEKSTVKELVKKIQKDYFEVGNVAENDYTIKTKRYAEIVRDIDRQIPLLYEQLAEMTSKDKSKTPVKPTAKPSTKSNLKTSVKPTSKSISKKIDIHKREKPTNTKSKKEIKWKNVSKH